jgi:hypothetical protein
VTRLHPDLVTRVADEAVKNAERFLGMEALNARHHVVTRSDAPVAQPGRVTVHEDLWSEVTFEIP